MNFRTMTSSIKKCAVLFVMIAASTSLFAQNKTMGVGIPTPNPNAALHVESPTGNQGFIMPRLTTAQRTGMSALLTLTDQGLMLYDTDLKTIFIWDGAAWKTTAQVAGGAKLGYPYKDSVTTNPPAGTFDVFALKYNGTVSSRVMRVESLNPNNQSSALSVQQQGRGLAGFFEQANDTTLSTTLYARLRTNKIPGPNQLAPVAIYGEATGVGGLGGAFWNTNTNNTFPALYARTLGTGPVARFDNNNTGSGAPGLVVETLGTGNAIQTTGKIQAGQFIGDGSLLTGINGGFSLPYVDTVTSIPNGGNAFRIVNNNTGTGNFGVAHFENLNPNSGFSAIFGRTNSTTNGVADFIVSNAANNNDAIGVITNGVGRAGAFTINNAANKSFAIYAQSNGDSTGAAVHGNNTGNGFGVFGKSAGTKFASSAVYGEHVGTGDAAGAFRISNAANNYSALYGETNGGGAAIFAQQLGTGRAGQFQISNATNTNAALRGFTSGLGNAAYFTINNAANDSSAVYSTTNGTGRAGNFRINNPASTAYALVGETNGAVFGAAVYGNNTGGGAGVIGRANGSALGSAAVYGEQLGTGDAAGAFRINNTANGDNAVYGETNGTASAINANQLGTGRGMIAQINNPANSQTAFLATTDGTGAAIQADQTNGGLALDIVNGGIKLSYLLVNSVGTITQRAGVYEITGATGTYNLPTTAQNGEICIVVVNNGSNASIEGIYPVADGTSSQFVRTSAGWIKIE